MRLLLLGATGLVGSHVLRQALADSRISKVIAPTRRKLVEDPKLETVIIDFDHVSPGQFSSWNVDAVICALGTTIKTAKTKEAFIKVDKDYPLTFAQLAKDNGVGTYVLNSAMGASQTSVIFYNRIKGEVEEGLKELGFNSLTIVRPGLIGGDRKEHRLGEEIAKSILSVLAPVIPKSMRVNPASQIAKAMLEAAIKGGPGIHTITSNNLV